MSNMILVEPIPIAASQITVNRGAGKDYLVDPERKHVFVDSAPGSTLTVDVDLGTATGWDPIAFIGINLATTWSVTGGASVTATTYMASRAMLADEALGPPYNAALYHHVAGASPRYLRASIARPGGSGTLTLGNLVVGKAWKPTFNMELDSGRGIAGTGSGAWRSDGGKHSRPGARGAVRSWVLGDLSDAELRQLYGIMWRTGEDFSLLVCEDPDFTAGQAERIGWGYFTGLEPYARRAPGKHRWGMTFRDAH